ncbi:MAG: gliding motility-associated C-terminal domain-containing protein, partial [Bacteroidales bacterium]|nr:gliding motility-associated C-terminal domain-containing protein [Bacteroidales bacterium]
LRNLLAHITGKLTWYDSGNNSLPTAPTPSTAAAGTQIYYVTQTANDCESDKATATVTVFALPNPEITASNDSVCQGTEIALGLQNDYVSQVWSCAPNNYLTATDEKNPKLMANAEANTYVIGVKVTDEHGCENSEESQKSLTILEIPTIQFDMDKNAVEIFEDISFINRIDTTAYDKPITWSWTIGEQYSGTDYSFPYVFAEDGTYDITLTGYIYEACKDSLTKSLLVLPTVRIPNVFTPNGDGINDIFFDGMPETELIIINRWGQELYKGLGGWDGTYNGKEMSAGTYFYMITLPNGKTFNGPLMLIRN